MIENLSTLAACAALFLRGGGVERVAVVRWMQTWFHGKPPAASPLDGAQFRAVPANGAVVRPAWLAAGVLLLALAGCGGGGASDGSGGSPGAQPSGTSASQLGLLAGGVGGAGHADGAATLARFDSPNGLALDPDGNLYVSDHGNGAIRKVTPLGEVSTLGLKAGGTAASGGQGGSVRIWGEGIAWDPSGGLLVHEGRSLLRVAPSGEVMTVAADERFNDWVGAIAAGAGRAYGVERRFVSCCDSLNSINLADPDPASSYRGDALPPLPLANASKSLLAVSSDAAGRVLVARLFFDDSDGRLEFFQLDPRGAFEKVSLPESVGRIASYCPLCKKDDVWALSVAWDGDDGFRILLKRERSPIVIRVPRDAPPSGLTSFRFPPATHGQFNLAGFNLGVYPSIVVDAQGRLLVTNGHSIRAVSPLGEVLTLAGAEPDISLQEQLLASQARPSPSISPFCDVAVGGNGVDVYAQFCESLEAKPRIRPPGPKQEDEGRQILRFAGGAGPVEPINFHLLEKRDGPSPFGVDAAGDIYIEGRRHSRSGQSTLHFDTPDFERGMAAVTPQGGAFYADRNQLRFVAPGTTVPVVLAGPGATPPSSFSSIRNLAVDAGGNAYVLDGHAIDANGKALVIDETSSTQPPYNLAAQIRKVAPDGQVTLLAGRADAIGADDGPAALATFRDPQGLAVDRRGNVYVADTGNHTIRKITPAGRVSTLVGVPGQKGVNLGPLPARLASPTSVAVDANDVLYIATPNAVLKVQLQQ